MSDIGKNKRRQLEAYDSVHDRTLSVDSVEEQDFINWLCEAYQLSVITDFQYQPESFQLFDNVKYTDVYGKTRTLFLNHKYSCDFIVSFDPNKNLKLSKELKIKYDQLSCDSVSAYIDTKGIFNRNARSFSTDRKWVWQKYKTYITEIIPVKFFNLFGVPKKSFFSRKTKKIRKLFKGMKSITDLFTSAGKLKNS